MKPAHQKFHFWQWLGILVLALAFAWLVRATILSLFPVIDTVPAVFSGETVTLQGKGFGAEGVLTLTRAGSSTAQVVQPDSWSASLSWHPPRLEHLPGGGQAARAERPERLPGAGAG